MKRYNLKESIPTHILAEKLTLCEDTNTTAFNTSVDEIINTITNTKTDIAALGIATNLNNVLTKMAEAMQKAIAKDENVDVTPIQSLSATIKDLQDQIGTDSDKLCDTIISTLNELKADILKGVEIAPEMEQQLADIKTKVEALSSNTSSIPSEILDLTDNTIFDQSSGEFVDGGEARAAEAIKNNSNEISNLINALTEIKQSCGALEDIVSNQVQEEDSWEEKFKAAASKSDSQQIENLWTQYYKELGEKLGDSAAEKIKDLGFTYKQELLKLGFDQMVNPFVHFVENQINTLNLTSANYPAVHNAYVRDYITKNDLRGANPEIGSSNLLFNKDLYSKDAASILTYLELQSKILKRYQYNLIADYFTDPNLAALYKNNPEMFLAVLFLAGKDPTASGTNKQQVSSPESALKGGKLKAIADIKKLLVKCFGEDNSKATWKNSMGNIIVQELKNPTTIATAIKYLIMVHNGDVKLADKYKEVSESSDAISFKLSDKLSKTFAPYSISKNNLVQVIDDIAKAAKFNLK